MSSSSTSRWICASVLVPIVGPPFGPSFVIVVFRGSVTALVPLFTVGALAAFTLLQVGMARHWWRRPDPGWQWHMAANGLGAMTTTAVLGIVVVSKFVYGVWMVVLILPLLVLAFHAIGVHHERLTRHVHIGSAHAASRILASPMRHHVVITVGRLDRIVLQAVKYAHGFNAQIEAMYVTDHRARGEELRHDWDAAHVGVPLVILDSPVRSFDGALLRYLDFVQKREDPHCFLTVILPELLPTRWWHPLLHNYFAWRLKWVLMFRPRTAMASAQYEVRESGRAGLDNPFTPLTLNPCWMRRGGALKFRCSPDAVLTRARP